jgi:hypothetical protein
MSSSDDCRTEETNPNEERIASGPCCRVRFVPGGAAEAES